MGLCKCGCGEEVQFNYKHGHGRRGKHNSAEHNLALKKANTGRILSDERRRQMAGYNTGRIFTPETRAKMSKTAKERGKGKWMKGRKLPFETVEKIREKLTGRPVSEKTRKKIGQSNSGTNNGMYGNHYTDAEKMIMSIRAKEMWKNPLIKEKSKMSRSTPEFKRYLRENALRIAEKFKRKGYHNTKPELKMVEILNKLNIQFIHPFPVWDIEHCFPADFFIPKSNTILEVDGIYWHNLEHMKEKDKIRTDEMKRAGYNVLRFWENEISEEKVKEAGL